MYQIRLAKLVLCVFGGDSHCKRKNINNEIPQQHEIWLSICTKYLTVHLCYWFEKEEEERGEEGGGRRRRRRGRRRHFMSMSKKRTWNTWSIVIHELFLHLSISQVVMPHSVNPHCFLLFGWVFFFHFEVVHIAHADFELAYVAEDYSALQILLSPLSIRWDIAVYRYAWCMWPWVW